MASCIEHNSQVNIIDHQGIQQLHSPMTIKRKASFEGSPRLTKKRKSPPDLHMLFLRLHFNDSDNREQAFRALLDQWLFWNGLTTGVKYKSSELPHETMQDLAYGFLNYFGEELWPSTGKKVMHLAKYNREIHGRRLYRNDWDGRMNRRARKTIRKNRGEVAKPEMVENLAQSEIGKRLQQCFKYVLSEGIVNHNEGTWVLCTRVVRPLGSGTDPCSSNEDVKDETSQELQQHFYLDY